jgi:hypothetical protein
MAMKLSTSNLQKVALCLLLTSSFIVVHPVLAGSAASTPEQTRDFRKDAIDQTKKAAKEKHARYSTEALDAIKAVEHCIALLDEGKKDEALKKLQEADGKLEAAITADPELKLIPVAASVISFDLLTTPNAVKNELDTVNDELHAGNIQQARVRMGQLRSEIVSSYIYLPAETYPDAIKRATGEITGDKLNLARDTLATAMETLVEETFVTPLPVVLAQAAILEAEKVQEKDKDAALRALAYASGQLETADRLGYFYGDKEDYTATTKHIEALQSAITGRSKIEELFDKAKNSTKMLLKKIEGKANESSK